MRKLIASLALAFGALVLAAPASADIVIRFTPATTHINVGGSASVEMTISGLDAEILSAFDINMLFNDSVVMNNSVTHNIALQWSAASVFGPSVFGAGDTGVIDYTFDDDATLAAGQANAFTVLTFGFTGLADGFSTINLGLDLDFERNFTGLGAESLNVQVIGACISVGTGECRQEVPEPSMLSLLGLALAGGVIGFRRRRTA